MSVSQGCPNLQHDNTNTAHLILIGQVLLVDTTRDRRCTVVIQVEMELAIAGTELELLEEQGVVVQSKGIKNVKLGLDVVRSDARKFRVKLSYLLGANQGIVD